MIGIVVAMESEAVSVTDKIIISENREVAGKKCIVGTLSGKETAIIVSGIGKVNAAIATQALIDRFHPAYIINFGTCGGTDSSVKVLGYYIVEKCAQYDFDLSELDGVPVGYIQDYNTVFFDTFIPDNITLPRGIIASSDRFNNGKEDIDTINAMGANLKDMEAGAVAQVCRANNVRLIMIKGVTDVYGNKTMQEQFRDNLLTVRNGFYNVLNDLVSKI